MMHLTPKPVGIGTALRSRKANKFLSFWSYTMLITWEFLGFCSRNTKNTTKIASEPRFSFKTRTKILLPVWNPKPQLNKELFQKISEQHKSDGSPPKVGILTRQSLNFLGFWKHQIWVFPKIGVPQNGWFIMENPIKMDDLKGYHHFRKHPYSHSIFSISPLRLGIKILPPRNFD